MKEGTMDMSQIGERLKALREGAGFSLVFLSKETGLTRQAINQIEEGKRNLNASELLNLAQLFNVSINDILVGKTGSESAEFHDVVLHLRKNSQLSEEGKKGLIEFKRICDDYRFLKGF